MTIMRSGTKVVCFMITIYVNLISDRKMVITSSYYIENMIEVNIWICCIMRQFMTKFGSLKFNNSGDTMINSDAIYYSDNFDWHIYQWDRCSSFWTVILPFLVPSKQIGKHSIRKYSKCHNLFIKFRLNGVNALITFLESLPQINMSLLKSSH